MKRYICRGSILLAVITSVIAIAFTILCVYPVSKDQILYAKYVDRLYGENAGVYAMNPSGNDVVRLTKMGNGIKPPIRSPRWSPNGNSIALWGTGVQQGANIYIIGKEGMDPDMTGYWPPLERVIEPDNTPETFCRREGYHGYDIYSLSWTMDGEYLAFTCPAKEDVLMCTVRLSDGSISCWSIFERLGIPQESRDQQLTKVDCSPTQNRLAFDIQGIHLADLDGNNLVSLGEGQKPSWSPNGERLVIFRGDKICIMNVDQDNFECPYTGPSPGEFVSLSQTPYVLFSSGATWSPNGRFIAFDTTGTTSENWGHAIHILDLKTKRLKMVTIYEDGRYLEPDWSP